MIADHKTGGARRACVYVEPLLVGITQAMELLLDPGAVMGDGGKPGCGTWIAAGRGIGATGQETVDTILSVVQE